MRAGTSFVIGLAIGLPAAMSIACDIGGTKVPGSLNDAAAMAGQCPNLADLKAVAAVDFAQEFGVAADVGLKLKHSLEASISLQQFAGRLEADLLTACTGLAVDLGAEGEWTSSEDACKAAMDTMAEVKAQLGSGVKLAVVMEPPRCSASLDAMAECVAECDVDVDPGSVEVTCEPGKLAGTCEAECTGSCDLEAAAACSGTCTGTCSAKFEGTCAGECTGRCDNKRIRGGSCEGVCKGTCEGLGDGTCGGQCEGSCEFSGAATCEGTCHGGCSVDMEAPQCEGSIEPPKASAECNASCDAQVQAEVNCDPGQLALSIEGAPDADLALKYKAAVEKNLPAIISIAVGMKDQALEAAANVQTVVEGAQSTIGELKSDAAVGARVTACVASPLKAAMDAAASIKASVSVSVELQASAVTTAALEG